MVCRSRGQPSFSGRVDLTWEIRRNPMYITITHNLFHNLQTACLANWLSNLLYETEKSEPRVVFLVLTKNASNVSVAYAFPPERQSSALPGSTCMLWNSNEVNDKKTYFLKNIQCFNCVGPPSPPISLSLEDDISSLLSQSELSSSSSSSSSSTSPPT